MIDTTSGPSFEPLHTLFASCLLAEQRALFTATIHVLDSMPRECHWTALCLTFASSFSHFRVYPNANQTHRKSKPTQTKAKPTQSQSQSQPKPLLTCGRGK